VRKAIQFSDTNGTSLTEITYFPGLILIFVHRKWAILKIISGIPVFMVSLLYLGGFSLSGQELLHRAHAHNDYQRNKPLEKALECGITSIEVDLFLHKGKLRVAHVGLALGSKPLFKNSYLDPLAKRVAENGGTVFPGDSTQLILMLEPKKHKEKLLNALKELLTEYPELFAPHRGELGNWAPIKILITGNPPKQQVLAHEPAILALDGSVYMLSDTFKSSDVPRISMNYKSTFKWRGYGKLTMHDYEKLVQLVAAAESQGKELRFWNMPNRPAIWRVFVDAGVHRINIDRYRKFRKFYFSQ
jgi:hypothetical protein